PPRLRQNVLKELNRKNSVRHRFGGGFTQAVAAAAVFIILVAGNILPAQQGALPKNDAPGGIFSADEAQSPEEDAEAYTTQSESGQDMENTAADDFDGENATADSVTTRSEYESNTPDSPFAEFRLFLNVIGIPLLFVLGFLAVRNRRESRQ
ncbi:MAG: hypothetical protein SCM57_07675, partial [Bacillota bacterium]|nr:hypothetical protein [Bacillota bacterium]